MRIDVDLPRRASFRYIGETGAPRTLLRLARQFALCVGLTASAASAQQFAPLSADFIPDTASIGQPINFRIFNNSTQTWQTGACDWFTIYASDPATGLPDQSEAIDHTLICTLPPVTTPPGYILEWDWDQFDHCPNCGVTTPLPPYPQPTAVPAGTYWFHAHPNGLSEWFSFRIAADPNEPTIAPITPTRIGLNCTYTIKAPNAPGAVFGVLIAFSQNNPPRVHPEPRHRRALGTSVVRARQRNAGCERERECVAVDPATSLVDRRGIRAAGDPRHDQPVRAQRDQRTRRLDSTVNRVS